jgi:hypothetical protein
MPTVTAANLKEKPVRDLARLAKQHGVAGWHSMRKDQLIRALIRKAKSSRAGEPGLPRTSAKMAAGEAAAKASRDAAVAQRIEEARARLQRVKSLATPPESGKADIATRLRFNAYTNIRAIAETGVTYISVGRITQSAPAADIGLDFG